MSDRVVGALGREIDFSLDDRTFEALRLVRDFVYEQTGNRFDDDALYLIRRRLEARLGVLSLPDFAAYHRFLRATSGEARRAELDEIADRITTNETYFFREAYQLDAFAGSLLPKLASDRARTRRLSIWSAGCSTGEEVYTIAILLLESGLFDGWDVRVFGSDLSRRVLKIARGAEYGPASFRVTSAERLARWFEPVGNRHRVRADVRALCRFGQINLVDPEMAAVLGEFDVTYCRNVLIYFDTPARRRVISTIERKLIPGGYLLLGHSESISGLSQGFELVHLPTDMVYRRPLTPGKAPSRP
jgi:chemotaxis protein methyltransferase CheR